MMHRNRRRCWAAWVLACLLMGFLSGSLPQAHAALTPTPSSTATPVNWTGFTDRNGLFSLRHPPTWSVSHTGVAAFSPSGQASQDLSELTENPVLAILPDEQLVTTDLSPQEAVQFWIGALRDNWSEVQVAFQSDRQIDGRVTAAARVSGVDRRTQIPFEMYLLVFDLNNQNCLVIAIAPKAQWDMTWPVMEQMFDTLKVLSPTMASAPTSGPTEIKRGVWDLELTSDSAARLTAPRAVGIGPSGQVYVVDVGGDRILMYDAQGDFLFAFGESGAKPGQFDFAGVGALAVDATGKVYVLDRGNRRIQIFNPTGELVNTISAGALGAAQGVAVSSSGQVYVSNEETRNIQIFDPEGHLIRQLVYKPNNGRVSSPKGLAIGPADRLYVADPVAQSIFVFDATGKLLTTLGSQSSEASYLAWPVAVAVDKGGQIYVGDTELRAVRAFTPEGQLLADQGPLREKGLTSPVALALDEQGRLYVADADGKRVVRYSLSGLTQAASVQLPLVNGSFQAGLAGWQQLPADMPSAGPSISGTVSVTDTGRLYGPALEIRRSGDGLSSGQVGVYQNLNIAAKDLKALHLLAQTMVIKEDGDNIGGPDSQRAPEAAIILKINYRDRRGNNGEWYHGFYSKSVPASDTTHFTTTPLEEWYQYKSDDLLAQIPDLETITGLYIYGSGRTVEGRVNDVQLVSQ